MRVPPIPLPRVCRIPAVERARILRLLIEKVDLDGELGKIGITFRPAGIAILNDELASAESAAR